LNGGLNMTEYEKQNQQPTHESSPEEFDPDYITGGVKVVTPEETDGLQPTSPSDVCQCGKFGPNKAGICGEPICANCKHAVTQKTNSPLTFCTLQSIKADDQPIVIS